MEKCTSLVVQMTWMIFTLVTLIQRWRFLHIIYVHRKRTWNFFRLSCYSLEKRALVQNTITLIINSLLIKRIALGQGAGSYKGLSRKLERKRRAKKNPEKPMENHTRKAKRNVSWFLSTFLDGAVVPDILTSE